MKIKGLGHFSQNASYKRHRGKFCQVWSFSIYGANYKLISLTPKGMLKKRSFGIKVFSSSEKKNSLGHFFLVLSGVTILTEHIRKFQKIISELL